MGSSNKYSPEARERAVRMKSPLAERPIFHQVQRRVKTHIFLCVLAYHLLGATPSERCLGRVKEDFSIRAQIRKKSFSVT